MTCDEVMSELESMGTAQCKKTYTNHGVREPFFGVRVGDMKKIVKKVKKNQQLASELFATGNADAQYLAGLIAGPATIGEDELQRWAEWASWNVVSEYAVAGVAAEGPHGWELGLGWIDSELVHVASSGWATLAGIVSYCPNEELDHQALSALLDRVRVEIHSAPNRVRYTMNGYVICVGCYVPSLTARAVETAKEIGTVHVDMGGPACKVPPAPDNIAKVEGMGRLGRKRKHVRC